MRNCGMFPETRELWQYPALEMTSFGRARSGRSRSQGDGLAEVSGCPCGLRARSVKGGNTTE